MDKRIELQEIFEKILESKNVYFNPPPNVKLRYPCIIYKLSGEDAKYASNRPYARKPRYSVSLIDKNPDSKYRHKIADLPLCAFDRYYAADNMNHFVYNRNI